jgi:hypothetical protein
MFIQAFVQLYVNQIIDRNVYVFKFVDNRLESGTVACSQPIVAKYVIKGFLTSF